MKDLITVKAPIVGDKKFLYLTDKGICSVFAVSMAMGVDFDRAYNMLAECGCAMGGAMNAYLTITSVTESKYIAFSVRKRYPNGDNMTIEDVLRVEMETNEELMSQGYMITSNNHIVYGEGLTLYSGAVTLDGTLKPWSRCGIDRFLHEKAKFIWMRPIVDTFNTICRDVRTHWLSSFRVKGVLVLRSIGEVDRSSMPKSASHLTVYRLLRRPCDFDSVDIYYYICKGSSLVYNPSIIGNIIGPDTLLGDNEYVCIRPRVDEFVICDRMTIYEYAKKIKKSPNKTI